MSDEPIALELDERVVKEDEEVVWISAHYTDETPCYRMPQRQRIIITNKRIVVQEVTKHD